MKFVMLMLLLVLSTAQAVVSVIAGPLTRPETGNAYYLLFLSTWAAAQQFAEDSLGGSLVIVDDLTENGWIHDNFYWRLPEYTSLNAWIGVQYDDVSDTWVGPQGETLSFVHWAPTYPWFPSNQPFGKMLMSGDPSSPNAGKWVNTSDDGYGCGIVEVPYVSLSRVTWAEIKSQF